jgi:hypothetical protein
MSAIELMANSVPRYLYFFLCFLPNRAVAMALKKLPKASIKASIILAKNTSYLNIPLFTTYNNTIEKL